MKILCLQLARFGDIYQTWPALNAIRRLNPDAEIHFLVRERFCAATRGLDSVNRVITLPSQNIFAPIFKQRPQIEAAKNVIDSFIQELHSENYDRIINLSFSPVSSYLVDLIAAPNAVISGYTRFQDGFLSIPDDASSYFYAQVGVDRANRIHVTDLFALVAGVELEDVDFHAPKSVTSQEIQGPYVVVHIGASDQKKNCSPETWQKIIEQLAQAYAGQIVFIGSKEEKKLVPASMSINKFINKVGETQIEELFSILKYSQALLACDSMALHMASLVGTPTLNLSFPAVRFWETGPRAKGSRVLWHENESSLVPQEVAEELMSIISGGKPGALSIIKEETMGVIYQLNGYSEDIFSWDLTRALYMSHPFPLNEARNIRSGFARLEELAQVALEQIDLILVPDRRALASSILDEVDSLVEQIGQFVEEIGPVVRWLQTEKLRIAPGDLNQVANATRQIFLKLRDICQIYVMNQKLNDDWQRGELTWKS